MSMFSSRSALEVNPMITCKDNCQSFNLKSKNRLLTATEMHHYHPAVDTTRLNFTVSSSYSLRGSNS